MKKRGFTLAEILISMALIGVIASLTLPTFVANSRNRANAAKLASTVNAVETALQAMMAAEAEDDFSRTTWGQDLEAASLGEFLKLNGSGDDMEDVNYPANFNYLTISGRVSGPTDVASTYITKNGAVLFVRDDIIRAQDINLVRNLGGSVTSANLYLGIDVNGPAAPNVWGRDAFMFMIGNDGMLYPAGSLNYSIVTLGNANGLWNVNNGAFGCINNTFTSGCTARLIENNYEVDY